MLVYLFVVAAIYTLSPITNAVSDCSLCKLNEYYNETTGYQCFRLSNGQVACTCPDYRYALDKPCRICERPNICGDDPNNLCAELSPTSFDPENDNDKNFACFCSDLSYYLGEPCPSNAIYEELSRSSSVAKTAVHDVERAYMTITNEYREQRNKLLENLHHVNKNIKESTHELDGIRKSLHTVQSFRLPLNSPRYSTNYEVHEMNAMVDNIERVLNKISQQLKQFHFIPSHGHAMSKTLGTVRVKDTDRKETRLTSPGSSINQYYSTENLYVYKLYTIDIDICAKWVISTIEQRIFLCDTEGEVRIYSYSRHLRRQPLLTERFHLSNIRLISSFTVTQDYLIAFEIDTQILTLHTHHGALILRLFFPYDPIMIVRCDYNKKNQIWTCCRTKRQCYQFNINHKIKQVNLLDQLDFTKPISNILIDPVGISCDEQDRVVVHDVNTTTADRLLLFTNNQNSIISLDFVKYFDKLSSSYIERVLLVPKQPNLIVIVYVPQSPITSIHEIVIVDISLQPAQILYCLSEANGIQSIDVTSNGELVYTVTTPTNKRTPPKMHIYSLIY
ncbi:unnamed protein product [Rotaria sordida]|uniref:Uncharacterized protein n=2 Tax=Rotaria sordida TaxID=392033 RepID=A0A818Z693_9BILA|nr:unnamed protein product [Rotaria sordida]